MTKNWLTTQTNTELNKEIQGLIWSQAKWKYGRKMKSGTAYPHHSNTTSTSTAHSSTTSVEMPRLYSKDFHKGVLPVDISLDHDSDVDNQA